MNMRNVTNGGEFSRQTKAESADKDIMKNCGHLWKQEGERTDWVQARFLLLFRLGIALSFLLVGLYYELTCAVISLYWFGLLFWNGRQRELTVRVNFAFLGVAVISFGYLISCFWAVDPGLALWGAVKYMPLVPAALCLLQTTGEERKAVLADLPWMGGLMTVATFLLQLIPQFSDAFVVSGRLAGFFQYPNTFACFLLLGIEILLLGAWENRPRWMGLVCGAVLVFGIIQAGSRTIFLFAVPALLACLIVRRTPRSILFAACSVGGGAVLTALISMVSSALSGAERVTEISAGASTLLGRLLYWKDALPVILKHPFGLGYLGYYFTQGSFQTGNYSVRWVHNDFLQLLLDIGWIPALLAVLAVILALCSRRGDALRRIVLVTLLAHCMMDFDLEFVAMYFVVMLCLDWEAGEEHDLQYAALPAALSLLLGVGSLYIGIDSALTYSGLHAAAAALYPWNTLSEIQLLTEIEDVTELGELADRILARNDQVALAWDAKALAGYSQGDFTTVITAKRQAISLAKYSLDEYVNYFELLAAGEALYRAAGDTESADYCLEEIASIQTMLNQVIEETDPLAWELDDPPELEMPEEYTQYLASIE